MIDLTLEINGINGIVKPLSHYCVSTHVGLRPYQGFWGFREKGHLFSGSWGALANILRDLGSKWQFREQKKKTFRELRKNKSGSWGEGSMFFREQGAKDPPGRASGLSMALPYQDTKGTLRVRRTYVSIRSSYSSIRSSYSSYAEVLRFLKIIVARTLLKNHCSTYVADTMRRTYVIKSNCCFFFVFLFNCMSLIQLIYKIRTRSRVELFRIFFFKIFEHSS